MIEARKSALFESLFLIYNRQLLRKYFASVRARNLHFVQQLDRQQPILCVGNHSSWWDGLIELFFSREVFDCEPYLMMDEQQMVRYKFFRWLGVFSVNRNSAREAYRSVRYAAQLFDRPNRFLWIYPQGVMQPNDTRPLRFYTGAARIVSLVGKSVQILPFAHRYELLSEQRPHAFTIFGAPMTVTPPCDSKAVTRLLETAVTELLERLRSDIIEGRLEEYTTLLHGATSVNVRFDHFRGMK